MTLMTWKKRVYLSLPFSIGALLFGLLVGWLLPMQSPFSPTQIQSYRGALLRQDDSGYSLIAPLLACDIGSEQAFPEFIPLKAQLTSLVQQKINTGDAQEISIYLRSLKGARWIEINSKQTYAPASLLKVFVMMAYLKEADDSDNPGLLQEKVAFQGSMNASNDNPGEIIPHLQNGELYTIEQVIGQMIIYSDNDALNTLVDHFDPQTLKDFEAIFKDLNIPSPVVQGENSLNFMSVDNYAMVFRVLFGSTYLPDRYSEMALELLSQAHYRGGLVAGVPDTLKVAHKFGVATVPVASSTATSNELHDCGIVYYPNHPYLLCVMTDGKNFSGLQDSIEAISRAAYVWLDSYYKSLPSSTASTSPPIVQH
jgi:beta-lactamase class A